MLEGLIAAGLVRPTVLVGYGSFGLDVLQRLLVNAALRGVLQWREAQDGGSAGERHLDELAMVWVQDLEDDNTHTRQDGSAEVLRDLYREIREVPKSSRLENDMVAAIEEKARQVLSASSRASAARPAASPLGLDVILIAHPGGPETMGTLDRMMTAAMEHLANYSNLASAVVQGSDPLVFVEILDFDNYWDRSDGSRKLRRAVHQSVDSWQNKRRNRRPAYSRIYLVDGASTREGLRSLEHRLDEISLFLELLLFEHPHQAEDPFRRLVSSAGQESPVGSFGIRLLERSGGLLSRLAAARFGIGWLDYLAEGSPLESTPEPHKLRDRLATYRAQELEELLEVGTFRSEFENSLETLERELLELMPEEEDWLDRVKAHYEQRTIEIQDRLAEMSEDRMVLVHRDRLAKLPNQLEEGIDADLRNSAQPVPLAVVLDELDRSIHELGELGNSEEEVEPVNPFEQLARLHSRYRFFNDDRLDLQGLKVWWWPLFALALAVGATPKAVEVLPQLVSSWPILANQLVIGASLLLLAWGVCAFIIQRLFTARSQRARRFFKDTDRGRFADRLRFELRPGGSLRAPLDGYLENLLRELRWGVRSDVRRELQRVRERLAERRREMSWLRAELREFLKLHGVSIEGGAHQLHRLGRGGTGIRHTVERGEDLDRVLAQNPPDPQRYRSLQGSAEFNPFSEWNQRHGQTFLYPLAFIEKLSRVYSDPFIQELARPGNGPEQAARERELLDFFTRYGNFDLAFGWKKQDGVSPSQRFALMPANWRRLPAVLPRLSELGIVAENVLVGADEARVYLLRVELGVTSEALEEPK